MSTTLLNEMTHALHAAPDAEDEATAWTAAHGLAAWLSSDETRTAALTAVSDRAKFGNGNLTYGETVDAVLAFIVESTGTPAIRGSHD